MELLNLSNDGLSIKDHAADTLNRISSRGNRQDFIDLYFLLQHFSLEDILDFYAKKHPNSSIYRALMSLTYFVDAEKFEMPTMFAGFDWEQCKSFILNEVKEHEKRY